MIQREDLIYAIRSIREMMGKQKWSWSDIESAMSGTLSFFGDVDEILEITRGEDKMTDEQKYRINYRMWYMNE